MIEMLAGRGVGEVDDLTATDVLSALRSERALENAAAARQLDLAARWADLHPPESIHSAAVFAVAGFDREEPIAGEGCPMVAEFCIAELGAVLGISTISAKKLVGHALELRHRLPRLWGGVQSGQVPAWRARSVAEATIHATPTLSPDAAAWVDVQVSAVAGRIGPAQLDRLVADAIKRHHLDDADPAADPEDGYLHVDPRHGTVHDQDVHFAGTMRFEAELDIADALDLDHALAHGAATLKALGSDASLDARRAAADGRADRTNLPAARELVIHAHLDASIGESVVFGPTGVLENGQRLVLLEHIKDWCTDSSTKVTIRPLIDLNATLSTPAYEVPDRIREQVVLRDKTCVFPWCTRAARGCDIDHVTPYDHHAAAEGRPQPGPTSTDNLAALCRSHHRLKTHTAWRYRVTGPGCFEWTSPHGHMFRRDTTGTSAIQRPGLVTGLRPSSTNDEAPPPDRP
jgi:hypothetical protein